MNEIASNTPVGQELSFDVDDVHAGERLDKFLAAVHTDLSRSRIKALVLQGNAEVNGQTQFDPSAKVSIGDEIVITIPPAKEAEPQPEDIPLDIVFEDDDLIVINKPEGMVVHPSVGNWSGTLVNALLFHCRDTLSGIGGVLRPGIVHRIDKDTSGLLVISKNDKTHKGLQDQFAAHTVTRTYVALVWGNLRRSSGTIDGNIGRSRTNRQKMALLKEGGRPATTHYKVLKRFGQQSDPILTLIECQLETGRTHQIRVHLASIGHPLVGDQTYGRNRIARKKGLSDQVRAELMSFDRQALHAQTLGFNHPKKGQPCSFNSDLPNDFKQLLSLLDGQVFS